MVLSIFIGLLLRCSPRPLTALTVGKYPPTLVYINRKAQEHKPDWAYLGNEAAKDLGLWGAFAEIWRGCGEGSWGRVLDLEPSFYLHFFFILPGGEKRENEEKTKGKMKKT